MTAMTTTPRPITSEDLYAIELAEDPRISPDGTQVAYVLMTMDRDAYEYRRSIWLASADGGEPRRFTSGPNDTAPRWSPDGRSLAFVRAPASGTKPKSAEERDRGVGQPQIWVIPTGGGEAHQVTFMLHGAGAPVWSPDGKTLLFAAETGTPDDQEVDDAALDGKSIPRVRTITQMWHRLDGHGFMYDLRSHLFTIPAAGGEPQQLTDGDWNDGSPEWSPDGSRIVFTSDRSAERWQWPADSVWTLDVASGACERLTDEALGCGAPSWSPNGETIAFLASPRRYSSGHTDLYTVPAHAGGEARLLSGDWAANCADTCISDMRAGHGGAHLYWGPDGYHGYRLYLQASLRGSTQVYSVSPRSDLSPQPLTDGAQHVYGFSTTPDCSAMALAITSPVAPGDVYLQRLPAENASNTQQKLTNLNAKLLSEVALATPEEFSFRGADDWELQGWVMRPPQAQPGELVPTILEIHGGPAAMYGASFFHEFQLLAAQGYAVVYCNPRGSTGYGRDFANAVHFDWGGKDYEDIMAGLDAAIARGGLDANRLGVAGGSYGGYMTNWVVGHSDRFKAAVTMRCVANAASFFGTSDIGWWLAVDEMGATPWENLAQLMQHSPITYVADIHTPLLILHSDNDLRCPISEGEQLFISLKYLGRETKLVRFEGQSHDLSRNGHPRSRVIRLNEITGWFARYLPTH